MNNMIEDIQRAYEVQMKSLEFQVNESVKSPEFDGA